MKTLADLFKENPQHYSQLVIEANKNGKVIAAINNKLVLKSLEVVELNYQEKRRMEYPSIDEQLDMLYWDKINGTNNWVDVIAEVKNKHPKQEVK